MATERFTPYQRRLFTFLSVATFFEGYDFLALAQILPNLRADMGLSPADAGFLFAFVNLGTIAAWPLIRRADVWGRRRVLTITIVGYTVFTFLSGLAWDVWSFAAFQFVARIFLIGEYAVAHVYAAEEFPASRRGTVVGVLQAFSSFGAILCAGVVPLLLQTEYGWRSVYFVGILPLILVAFARRNLAETQRFTEQVGDAAELTPMFRIFGTAHRTRVLQLGAIWFVTYACSNTAISFWKEFVVAERGFTDADVGHALPIAAVISLPLIFLSGKLLDAIGRRPGAAVIFVGTSVGVYLAYSLESKWALTAGLTIAIFGVSAVLPVLNAYTSELFPTELRGDAYAWANNLIGRVGYVLMPILVGQIAEAHGWGAGIRWTAVFPLVALGMIFWLLPETRGRELEDTAAA
jgi:putative MFS transporter